MVLRRHLCHRCVCVCHMVLLPEVCVCHMRAVTPSLSQASLPPFPAPCSRCPNACVRRGKAWGGGAGQKACALLVVLDLLQLGPCRITLAFTRCMAHDGMDGWCAGGIDGRIRLWDILQVSSPVGGRCECRVRRVGCVKHGMRCRERNCNAVFTTQLAPHTWQASANSTRAHTARVASFHASAEWAQRMGNERHVAPRSQCAPQHWVAFAEHGGSAGARRRRSDSVSWAAVCCGDAG
jgi:hypothetical protein